MNKKNTKSLDGGKYLSCKKNVYNSNSSNLRELIEDAIISTAMPNDFMT